MLLFECELINLVYHESRESFFTIGCGIYLFACYQLFHAAKPDTCQVTFRAVNSKTGQVIRLRI